MKRNKILLLTLLMFSIVSCGDDDGGITEEQRQLIMGDDSSANIVSLGLTSPIVLSLDQVHITPRQLDINFDQTADIVLSAYEEFNGNKGLTLNTESVDVRVSVDGNGDIKALNSGDIVTATSETWVNASTLPLAEVSGQTVTGLWNGLQNRFIAVRIDIGSTRYLGWIELSVNSYDNYSLHNYVVKLIP
ncbi:hypothetical protein [Roseivirga sp. E12]|uniref:hypothetical protein n=1 Tax=Roseivirga sp. E12 TaxID=2819237 RepID=UPI001ABC9454|nr:hypothetical protein [Roseivirga sp. E12]MBO3698456.1 hypothetical protein [Roseivirga sp. E12]